MLANLLFVNPFNDEPVREYAHLENPIVPRDGDLITLGGRQYKVQGVPEFDYDVFSDDPAPGRVAIIIQVKPATFRSYGT